MHESKVKNNPQKYNKRNSNENSFENTVEFKKDLVRKGYENEEVVNRYSKTGLWKSENYLINKFFEKNNNPQGNMKILDIGCGCGRTTIPLKQKGYDVSGIDLSEHMINRAKINARTKGLDINFQVMDACKISFPNAYFDNALFSYNGIEHIPNIDQKIQVLREVFRVLKPGGYFMFTVHSGIPNLLTFKSWIVRSFDTLKVIRNKKEYPEIKNLEPGEQYYNRYVPESIYTHTVPVYRWKRILNSVGFDLSYINTRRRVSQGKKQSSISTIFYSFENFIVAKKPSAKKLRQSEL